LCDLPTTDDIVTSIICEPRASGSEEKPTIINTTYLTRIISVIAAAIVSFPAIGGDDDVSSRVKTKNESSGVTAISDRIPGPNGGCIKYKDIIEKPIHEIIMTLDGYHITVEGISFV
jgi:hypothetical protein